MPDSGERDFVRDLLAVHGITPLPEELERLVIAYDRARRNVEAMDEMLDDDAEPVVIFSPRHIHRVGP